MTDDLAGLRTEPRTPAVGDRITVAADAFPTRVPDTGPQAIGAVELALEYVTASGSPGTAILRAAGFRRGGPGRREHRASRSARRAASPSA